MESDATLASIAQTHAHSTVEEEYFGSATEDSSPSTILDQQSLSLGAYQTYQFEGYPTGKTADTIAERLYNEFLMDSLQQQSELTHIGVGVCWNPRGGIHGRIIRAKRLVRLPDDIAPSRLEQAIHTATNDRRREHGCQKLSYDSHLAAIATQHSQAMAAEEFVAHEAPDGTTMSDRYREYTYAGERAGENIAKEYGAVTDDAESIANKVVDGWMGSSGHRKNILTEDFENEGVGVFQRGDGALLVTQNFS